MRAELYIPFHSINTWFRLSRSLQKPYAQMFFPSSSNSPDDAPQFHSRFRSRFHSHSQGRYRARSRSRCLYRRLFLVLPCAVLFPIVLPPHSINSLKTLERRVGLFLGMFLNYVIRISLRISKRLRTVISTQPQHEFFGCVHVCLLLLLANVVKHLTQAARKQILTSMRDYLHQYLKMVSGLLTGVFT